MHSMYTTNKGTHTYTQGVKRQERREGERERESEPDDMELSVYLDVVTYLFRMT